MSKSGARIAILMVLMGILMGILIGILQERRGQRVHSPFTLRRRLRQPSLS